MDEFNTSFGRLSTAAAEWKPQDSDLRAVAVKEFIPGQGWNSQPSPGNDKIARHVGQESAEEPPVQDFTEFKPYESTVPAGPTPPIPPSIRALHSLAMPDDLWRFYRGLALECNRQMNPSDQRHKAVPMPYCNAYCLDDGVRNQTNRSFGYPSAAFQVTSRDDGHLYCLRRFDNVRSVSPKIAAAVSDRWKAAQQTNEHPGVVAFYHAFVAQRAVFFCHQYIPGARTLRERLTGPLAESAIWSCVTQLVAAIRKIHGDNLAVRSLQLNHILSTSDSLGSRLRLRINCLGIVDALEFEARKPVADLQRQDMRDLGFIIMSLATGTEVTFTGTDSATLRSCESFMMQNYSRDLHNLTITLIRSVQQQPSIFDVSRALATKVMDEQDLAYRALDQAEHALAAEYDAGRALRILLKLGFVNERPEFGLNRRWSESGDCYVLALFRDYVFHQADAVGNPVMDLGHVVTSLNKLDAADEERIVLSSRDGKSLMIVSYADIARCLESAFQELCSGSVPLSALQY